MSLDDKWEKREARLRGSGTRDLKLEEFSIASPETPKQKRLLKTLDSAFTKQDDHKRPRLRRTNQPPKTSQSIALEKFSAQQRENRKLTFSSDEDDGDDEDDNGENFESASQPSVLKTSIDYDSYDHDFDAGDEPEPESVKPAKTNVKKEHIAEVGPKSTQLKRRRGRPKKEEREEKVSVVTRRSRRIEDNPSLRQTHVPDSSSSYTQAKPLKALGLTSLVGHRLNNGTETVSEAASLTTNAKGKQRSLVIDAERIFTPSTRNRRVTLNTLDVLQQFIEEHTPKPVHNELVNENQILTEFKAHLKYNIAHLMDLHASIFDISQDINEVQRRKNDVRRSILEIRRKHAEVGTELAKERKMFADNKAEHQEFMTMANSLKSLKAAIMEDAPETASQSELVNGKIDEVIRIVHPTKGLSAQLRSINAGLSETLNTRQGA